MGLFSRFLSKRANLGDSKAEAGELTVLAPVTGRVVTLESTSDPAFSSRAMGDGVAIVPTSGEIVAPVSGTVGAIFPTAHALAIAADDGSTQVMIHIGIDTVKLDGAGFTAHVAQGDRVSAGQPLVSVDLDEVASAGFDATTFVVVCERADGTSVRERASGPVSAGEGLLWLS